MAITVVLQSSSTVSVIAVTMASAGLLDASAALIIIAGANAGSGLSVLLMSSGQAGSTRQLALVQVQAKLVASLLGVVLLFTERYAAMPGLVALGQAMGVGTPALGAAWFLALQVVGALASMCFGGTFLAFAARLAPESTQEALARPRYLSALALEESSTAMELLELEQARLVGHLSRYFSQAEPAPRLFAEEPSACRATAAELADADARVLAQVGVFMAELADRPQDRESAARLFQLQERLRCVRELGETVRELDAWLLRIDAIDDPNREQCVGLKERITDSCHFLLGVLHDAATTRAEEDLGILDMLAHDRSEVMDALRKGWLQQASSTGQAMLEALFAATSLVERFVWILRRLRQTLEAAPQNR
jgi:phosphate:Na+ symporter